MSGVGPFYINIHSVTFGKTTGRHTYQTKCECKFTIVTNNCKTNGITTTI